METFRNGTRQPDPGALFARDFIVRSPHRRVRHGRGLPRRV